MSQFLYILTQNKNRSLYPLPKNYLKSYTSQCNRSLTQNDLKNQGTPILIPKKLTNVLEEYSNNTNKKRSTIRNFPFDSITNSKLLNAHKNRNNTLESSADYLSFEGLLFELVKELRSPQIKQKNFIYQIRLLKVLVQHRPFKANDSSEVSFLREENFRKLEIIELREHFGFGCC